MVSSVRSLGLYGVSGYEVKVECDISSGLPAFDVVGLPDTAVKEARNRVRSAAKNSGFAFPVSRITVNLGSGGPPQGGDCLRPAHAGGAAPGQRPAGGGSGTLGLCRRGGPLRPAASGAGDALHGPGRPAGRDAGIICPRRQCA